MENNNTGNDKGQGKKSDKDKDRDRDTDKDNEKDGDNIYKMYDFHIVLNTAVLINKEIRTKVPTGGG